VQQLRAELAGMKQGALSRRAREAGVTAEQLEDALDEDDPTAAVVELIVRATPLDADVSGALRAELAGLKQGALSRRAREAGVTDEQLDDALDADDPKEAVVELIVRAMASGAGAAAAGARASWAAPDVAQAAAAGPSLREELAEFRNKQLKTRAKAGGASEHQIDDVDDADDPKAALIDLIVALETGGGALPPAAPDLYEVRRKSSGALGVRKKTTAPLYEISIYNGSDDNKRLRRRSWSRSAGGRGHSRLLWSAQRPAGQ
jgi:DNA-binding phage protein